MVASTSPKKIQTFHETSLHASIKEWYARPGDFVESHIDGYRVDLVRGDLLIEIQVKNFVQLKDKLDILLENHRVHLVHPIASQRWIKHNDTKKRRLSPRKGKVDHIFQELVYITPLLSNSNLSVEILLIHEEEIRANDGRGSWRRKGISIVDRNLLAVVDQVSFEFPICYQQLLGAFINQQFTSKDIALHRNISENLSRKMMYCFWKTNLITKVGRRGHHNLYSLRPHDTYK